MAATHETGSWLVQPLKVVPIVEVGAGAGAGVGVGVGVVPAGVGVGVGVVEAALVGSAGQVVLVAVDNLVESMLPQSPEYFELATSELAAQLGAPALYI